MSQPRQWRATNRDDEYDESYEESSQRETSERTSGTGVARQVNDRRQSVHHQPMMVTGSLELGKTTSYGPSCGLEQRQ